VTGILQWFSSLEKVGIWSRPSAYATFAAFPAIVLRQFGARLIVFESWSRFENRSKCSRVLYRFAHRFLIQHKELQVLYPEATWVGEEVDSGDHAARAFLQIASGAYTPKVARWGRFVDDFQNRCKAADIVVCHGGAGSLVARQ